MPDTGLVPGYSRDRRLGEVPALWSCILREELTTNVETNVSIRECQQLHMLEESKVNSQGRF